MFIIEPKVGREGVYVLRAHTHTEIKSTEGEVMEEVEQDEENEDVDNEEDAVALR